MLTERRNRIFHVLKQIEQNKITAKREKQNVLSGEQPWAYYGANCRDYERVFKLKPDTFQSFLKDSSPSWLDIGSDPTAIRSVENAFGVSMGLFDPRDSAQQLIDAGNNIYMVEGDVLRLQKWREIELIMKHFLGINGFSLITSVAEGGLKKVTNSPSVHLHLLQEMWKLLIVDGMLVAQMEMETDNYCLPGFSLIIEGCWLGFLNEIPGIEASFVNGGIKLIRHKKAPHVLPLNPALEKLMINGK